MNIAMSLDWGKMDHFQGNLYQLKQFSCFTELIRCLSVSLWGRASWSNSALFHLETSQTHKEASDPLCPTFLLHFFILNLSFVKLVIILFSISKVSVLGLCAMSWDGHLFVAIKNTGQEKILLGYSLMESKNVRIWKKSLGIL